MTALDPTRTFATFVVGGANQLAAAAARTLAEAARPPFNPLYLWGDPGQGKSHLLHAIGAHRRSVDPAGAVEFLRADEFLASARDPDRLAAVTLAPLLLLDEVDRLEAAPERGLLAAVLEERISAGRATVVAATAGPTEWLKGDDTLSRGLGGGLVVEIAAPDETLREELVRRRAEFAGVSFARAVVEEVIRLPLGSVQELLGTVNRLIAFQEVSSSPLDPVQARVLITGIPPTEPEPFREPSRPAPAVAVAQAGGGGGEEGDEFGSFLSEVVAGVSEQVDLWRSRVADAVLRWEAEGIQCGRLHALLDQELAAQPDAVLRQFEDDVRTMQRVRAELEQLAPDLAGSEVLRNPDQVAEAGRLLEEARTRGLAVHGPNPDLVFDGLIEVPGNQAVFQAAREAAERAGPETNPLLLVGGTGAAKSHLLHAVGHLLAERDRRAVVVRSALALVGEAEEASRERQLGEWARRYQYAGALLIDDLHQLAGHDAVQQELVGVVDALLGAGRPVAATSAVPPSELEGLLPQLLTRMASGLVLELPPPDRDVRRGLIGRLLDQTEAAGDAGLVEYLAQHAGDTIRAVHGAVRRVLVAAADAGSAPSVSLARQVLDARPGSTRPSARAGVLGPQVAGNRLAEKLVSRWPDPRHRLLEEMG